ncbi:hypothetical protein JN11_01039 [Mucilaginibacter frigoritolerans]|uniref:Uncharacterized protein n=1 Tax=Mucilaginibacter frigoritolerans TaxID=652788 RepID=A0A562UDR0_9SPHI|nr:hypothetical protein [Mucilaginibacter frigoritolerans]TWJ03495.1 hypothetical protein JN11_01039 [Mucilaginibacter frigoritolerans]
MKKSFACFVLLLAMVKCFSQNTTDQLANEQTIGNAIFLFAPVQREGVTEQRFHYAQQIINDTKSASKNNVQNLNAADFWNITTAFVILKEPKSHIEAAFNKAIHSDAATICSYIKAMGTSNLDKLIPESFLPFYSNCAQSSTAESSNFNVANYAENNKLNPDLVSIISMIQLNDSKFRMTKPVDWTKQKPLDERNQQLIDSLFNVYQTYIGRQLVGKQFEATMWLVVQHSPLEMMEKYLSVVATAVNQKQLDQVPLKMLVDRIYWLKYDYQIFGSQGSQIRVADDKTREEVIKRYNLN